MGIRRGVAALFTRLVLGIQPGLHLRKQAAGALPVTLALTIDRSMVLLIGFIPSATSLILHTHTVKNG